MIAMATVVDPDAKTTLAIVVIVLACTIISVVFYLIYRFFGATPADAEAIINTGADALTDNDGDGQVDGGVGGCMFAVIIAAVMALAFFSVSVIIYFLNAAYKAIGG